MRRPAGGHAPGGGGGAAAVGGSSDHGAAGHPFGPGPRTHILHGRRHVSRHGAAAAPGPLRPAPRHPLPPAIPRPRQLPFPVCMSGWLAATAAACLCERDRGWLHRRLLLKVRDGEGGRAAGRRRRSARMRARAGALPMLTLAAHSLHACACRGGDGRSAIDRLPCMMAQPGAPRHDRAAMFACGMAACVQAWAGGQESCGAGGVNVPAAPALLRHPSPRSHPQSRPAGPIGPVVSTMRARGKGVAAAGEACTQTLEYLGSRRRPDKQEGLAGMLQVVRPVHACRVSNACSSTPCNVLGPSTGYKHRAGESSTLRLALTGTRRGGGRAGSGTVLCVPPTLQGGFLRLISSSCAGLPAGGCATMAASTVTAGRAHLRGVEGEPAHTARVVYRCMGKAPGCSTSLYRRDRSGRVQRAERQTRLGAGAALMCWRAAVLRAARTHFAHAHMPWQRGAAGRVGRRGRPRPGYSLVCVRHADGTDRQAPVGRGCWRPQQPGERGRSAKQPGNAH